MYPDPEHQRRSLPLREVVANGFDKENWLELGAITGCIGEVQGHQRLLRSLSWGDPDYPGNVLDVLLIMVQRDPRNLARIEDYVVQKLGGGGISISSASGSRKTFFTPHVFEVPDTATDKSLVAVMMPFENGFGGVSEAIKKACSDAGLQCQRVDDMWENTAIIQDVFSLIWRSFIVICDFTGRNANVFYECGIAHTLGKHVIPIAQHDSDVPFDLRHHRYLRYLSNDEGLSRLRQGLSTRLRTLTDKDLSDFSVS